MGLARALILCSSREPSNRLIDLLTSNGYTVHLLTDRDSAEKHLGKPVDIHLLANEEIGEDLDKVLGEVGSIPGAYAIGSLFNYLWHLFPS